MGSCMNGHLNKGDSTMPEQASNAERVVILDAGAQYGKVKNVCILARAKAGAKVAGLLKFGHFDNWTFCF